LEWIPYRGPQGRKGEREGANEGDSVSVRVRLGRLAACVGFSLVASARDGEAADHRLEVGGSVLNVSVTATSRLSEDSIVSWVDAAARGVTAYFGRYPVPEVRLSVRRGGSGGVSHGVTFAGRVPSITISVGRETTEEDLRNDWVLTHEMTHLAFPDLADEDSWAEEGLATYVEPLARVRVGTISEDKIWVDLMEGIPNGLPRKGDRGLHGTRDWGRTYWGGALFWLLADIGIREKTNGRNGLPDALAAILQAGGDIRARWELSRALTAADRALRLTVLSNLYRDEGIAPGTADLPELWRRLGVRLVGGHVLYDDAAPLAGIRRAISAPTPRGGPGG
jgi:hypothetical protein